MVVSAARRQGVGMAERRDVFACIGCRVLEPSWVQDYGVVCLRTREVRSVLPPYRPPWCPMWSAVGRPGREREAVRDG